MPKGLRTGDRVVLESPRGRRADGHVVLTEAIHPEAVGVAGCAGHFTAAQPIAHGKGVPFNELIEVELDNFDPFNLSLDLCVKVRIVPDPRIP